jgi:hypothetical protein
MLEICTVAVGKRKPFLVVKILLGLESLAPFGGRIKETLRVELLQCLIVWDGAEGHSV